MVPHPAKAESGGEDAYYSSSKFVLVYSGYWLLQTVSEDGRTKELTLGFSPGSSVKSTFSITKCIETIQPKLKQIPNLP